MQGYTIHPIEKIVAAAALSLYLLGAAQAAGVSDTARTQDHSPTPTFASTYSGTKLEVRTGDTLASIARAIYPDNAPMRDKLVRAIIAANPDISTDGKSVHLVVGSALTLPDLRTLSASKALGAKAPADKSKSITVDKTVSPIAPAIPVTTAASKQIKPAAELPPLPALQEQAAPGKSDTGGGFRLKLSTGVMNLSVIGKLSEEELKRRREGQLLLDSDDPAGSFLALKRQIKHLQTQVEELQLKLDLGKNRAPLAATTAPASAAVAPVVTKPTAPSPASIPFIPAAYTPVPTNDTLELIKYALTLYLFPAAEITLALLALFFILRYYRNLRSRMAESGELAAAAQNRVLAVLAKKREATADISSFDKNLVISTAAHIEVVEDTDTILQDAQLFVIHGYPDKAIELLEEQLATNHKEVRVWMLLFVILRSQGIKEEFDKFARRFRTLINDQNIWKNIQDLGQELDPANPLYLNKRNRRLAEAVAAANVATTSPPNVTPAALFPGVSAIADTPVDFTAAPTRSPHDT